MLHTGDLTHREAQVLEDDIVSKTMIEKIVREKSGCILLLTGTDFSIKSTNGFVCLFGGRRRQ